MPNTRYLFVFLSALAIAYISARANIYYCSDSCELDAVNIVIISVALVPSIFVLAAPIHWLVKLIREHRSN